MTIAEPYGEEKQLTITEAATHSFGVIGGYGTTAVPVGSSNIVGNFYLNGGATPVLDNVTLTLTVRGQGLAVQGINIDEMRKIDARQRDAISVID